MNPSSCPEPLIPPLPPEGKPQDAKIAQSFYALNVMDQMDSTHQNATLKG